MAYGAGLEPGVPRRACLPGVVTCFHMSSRKTICLLRLATSGLGLLLAVGMAAPVTLLVVSSAPTVAYAEGQGDCEVKNGVCKLGGGKMQR